MKFDVPDHAKMRITERGIDVDSAKRVIRNPEKHKILADGRSIATASITDGRILTVVYVQKTKNHAVIITGYYEG